MNYFINNREVIRNLSLNTGTEDTPVFTTLCTTSEVELITDMESKDFFVFCDAIKRSVITGITLSIETTVKIDMNNVAIQKILTNINDIITSGSIASFNNLTIQFELLETIANGVLTYQKYEVPVNMKFSDLGGASEDEGEFSLEIMFNGKGTEVSA